MPYINVDLATLLVRLGISNKSQVALQWQVVQYELLVTVGGINRI